MRNETQDRYGIAGQGFLLGMIVTGLLVACFSSDPAGATLTVQSKAANDVEKSTIELNLSNPGIHIATFTDAHGRECTVVADSKGETGIDIDLDCADETSPR